MTMMMMMMVMKTSAKGGVKCDICSTTSIVVENVLLHNATAGFTFQNAAAALCANVPREMRETVRMKCQNITQRNHKFINILQCESATARLNGKVFECLVKQLEFGSICSDPFVDLCVAERTPFATDNTCEGFDPDPMACAACEFAVGGLQQYVNDTSTEIVKAVRQDICHYHFKEEHQQEECDVTFAAFGDVALRVLASRLDAAEFCCGLGLCESVSSSENWIRGPVDLNSAH